MSKYREFPLQDVSKLIESNFNDHRDFYSLANLIKNGFLDVDILEVKQTFDPKVSKYSEQAENIIAIDLYMSCGKLNEYLGIKRTGHIEKKLNITAKGDLYLTELHLKRLDRMYTLLIGAIIGAISAWLGAYFQRIMTN